MDKVAVGLFRELELNAGGDGAGVTVGAERLLMAGGAAGRGRARHPSVLANEVALMRKRGNRRQRIARQVAVAARAVPLVVFLLVLVTGKARRHRRWRRALTRLRQALVTARAV